MDTNAIVTKAIDLLESGPLPDSHKDHGEWCPYCAIALAKSLLDDDAGSGLPTLEVFRQCFYGITETDSDAPLVSARKRLGNLLPPYERDSALSALKSVLDH